MAFLPKYYQSGKAHREIYGQHEWCSTAPDLFMGSSKLRAILLMSFCVSNIIGPLTFQPGGYTLPEYIPAKISSMATGLLAIAAILVLLGLLWRENRKRDREERDAGGYEHVVDSEFMDRTDKEKREFRYFFGEIFRGQR
jgi:hypothetical protein